MNEIEEACTSTNVNVRAVFFDKLEAALCVAWDLAFFLHSDERIPCHKVALDTQCCLSGLIADVRKAKKDYIDAYKRDRAMLTLQKRDKEATK
jgi:hypothetical protein